MAREMPIQYVVNTASIAKVLRQESRSPNIIIANEQEALDHIKSSYMGYLHCGFGQYLLQDLKQLFTIIYIDTEASIVITTKCTQISEYV